MKITTLDLTNSSQNNINITHMYDIEETEYRGVIKPKAKQVPQTSIPRDSVWMKIGDKESINV